MSFDIGADKFQVGKMNAFDQLKVMKRLIEPFGAILDKDLLSGIAEDIQLKRAPDDIDLQKYLTAFSKAMKSLSDEDLEFVIMKCCANCECNRGGAWAPILTPQGVFAFPDLQQDAGKLLRISFEVIRSNLSGFFDALPQILGAGVKK